MPKSLPIFSSFSSGEITPRLASRSDVDAYKNGCNIMRNMTATSHGPAARRYGLQYVGHQTEESVANEGAITDGRVFGFSISKSVGTFVYVALLEDGTSKIAPYDPTGVVIPPTVELVTNSRFEEGGTGWTDLAVGSGRTSFVNGTCNMLSGAPNEAIGYTDTWTSVAGIPASGQVNPDVTTVDIAYTSGSSVDRTVSIQSLKNGDPLNVSEQATPTRYTNYTVVGNPVDNTTYATVPVVVTGAGNPVRDGEVLVVEYTSTNPKENIAGVEQEVTGTVSGNTTRLRFDGTPNPDGYPLRITIGTAQGLADIVDETIVGRDLDVTFDPLGTSVWYKMWVDEGLLERGANQVSIVDESANPPEDIEVVFDGPWTDKDIPVLQADSPPEGDVLYITSPYTAPHKLTYDQATQGWTFEIVTFTGTPTEWTGENWPRAITFYQGRMWLGGTSLERETFWASKSGAIENFTQGANADDGLEFTLSEQGEIEWVTGAKNLIIGTANGEHIVESSSGVIIPSDIQITQQSAYGSRAIQSEKIGQKVMYVSPDGRKVREIGYQWTDDGWLSRDITFASEHITMDNNIKRIAFAQNPDNLLWCVTDQGDAVCCTYEKTYDVIGWHRHDTVGEFIDVASFDLNGTSIAGFLVKRSINGNPRMSLELLDPYDTFYCDDWVYQYYEEPTVEVSGLEHLAGNTVDVLTDSGVHPSVPVDADGIVYLQWEANEVVCGHNYVSHLRTLSPDMIGNEGSTHAMEKSWNRVVVRVYDSLKPLINDVRPPERLPNTPMGTYEPGKTEDCQAADLGWQSWDWVDVKQDLPGKLTILGIFGEQQREHL